MVLLEDFYKNFLKIKKEKNIFPKLRKEYKFFEIFFFVNLKNILVAITKKQMTSPLTFELLEFSEIFGKCEKIRIIQGFASLATLTQ